MNKTDRVRVGDPNRESALAAFAEHFAANRLTMTEYSRRRSLVPSARRREDLRALFDDLPEPHPDLAPVTRARKPVSGVGLLGALVGLLGIPASLAALFTTGAWWWLPAAIGISWFLSRLGNGIEREKARPRQRDEGADGARTSG